MPIPSTVRRLALLVGGGPAPGINGVISAVTIEADERGIEVYGIQDGYKWLMRGDATHIRRLYKNDVKQIYIRGGSILGTSRDNPTKDEDDMNRVLDVFDRMEFDALVSIGGDDTAKSASMVYDKSQARRPIRVAHVPKTIDNDLALPGSTPTFGFETARHHGVNAVRRLAEDARTTSRWYIIISMGRAAGHLALGIGKASAATLTIIPEEFGLDEDQKPNKITLKHLSDIILGSIIKRLAERKSYGLIVLAEGLIESVKDDLKDILDQTGGKYGNYETDAHDNLRLGEIEFGMLIRDLLIERLKTPKESKDKVAGIKQRSLHEILKFEAKPYGHDVDFISKDLGYELRSADPIPFDAEYTRDLGYSAVKFLLSEAALEYGAIIGFIQGNMKPIKFDEMRDKKTNRMRIRLVNIEGEGFEVALSYMIRLEEEDFADAKRLEKFAKVVNMTPEEFRAEFEYLVQWKKWSNAERRQWNDKH